ncbi:MAG: C39 family peptidase, partial [Cyanobacteria bacterium]|nr:C39 family peptidase [Cyanobacteriota bacterium]MDW8200976.1 C39 family peptidase [Cyanobacteriota bacterium SKYGB_h_bin112]
GLDANGATVSEQVPYITVTDNPRTVGKPYILRILNDTFFKVSSADSTTLNSQQKVVVRAGQTFNVVRYGYTDGHLNVDLAVPIPPVGASGFFFAPHVQLLKGNEPVQARRDPDPPDTLVAAQANILATTLLKLQPVDSSTLPANQMLPLRQGQVLELTGYACVPGHFRLSLARPIPNFGSHGFVFKDHVQVVDHRGRVIAFNPNAFSIVTTQPTVFKKSLANVSQLPANDKISLPANRMYGVAAFMLAQDHIKVSLTEEFPGFGNTGFIFQGHIRMMRGGKVVDVNPSEVTLSVPYFSQRDNSRKPWATCNVTSIAMVLYYHGVRPKNPRQQLEDELYDWCISRYGQNSQTDNGVLANLIKAYGFKNSSFSTTRRWEQIKRELVDGYPVVVGGYFTHGGHIITVIGFNERGYLAHDPWGDATTGYRNKEGRRVHYSNGYMNEVAGPNGNVWAHFIRP